MENQKNQLLTIGKNFLKVLAGLILFVLLLFVALLLAIRIPAVQTRAVQEASEVLSEKLNHQVSVERVDIAFFSRVILDKVKVLDYKKEVLFYVGRLDADISFFSLFHPDRLSIAQLTLEQPRARLVKYQASDSLNMTTFIRAVNRLLAKKDSTKPKKPFSFSVDAIQVINGRFSYDDQNKPRQKGFGVDYQHMDLDSIYVNLSKINLGDTLGVHIADLRAKEINSSTRLKELDARMSYAPTFWEFADLRLRLGKSYLAQYVRFDFQRFGNFTHFNDSVTVTANLRKADLYSDDIARFAPQIQDLHEHLRISGDIKGQVKRFHARQVDARYGRYSHLVGDISAHGLPAIREAFFELDLKPSVLHADDLRKYLPQKAYTLSSRLGRVKLQGSFLGFYNDFVANGTFATALGRVTSDLNLKINKKTDASSYSGYLKTEDFKLGQLLGNTRVVNGITMSGKVRGSGFDLETAHLHLDATIQAVNLYNYNYRNIVTNADLSKETFTGEIAIRDPNASLTATGNVNLSQTAPAFNLVADVQNLNLRALGLTRQAIRLKTQADLNFSGLQVDALLGRGTFTNTVLTLNNQVVSLDSALIVSSRQNGVRTLKFDSELADITATGTWNPSTLIKDLQVLVKEYRLNFESNDPVTAAYYRRKPKYRNQTYDLQYEINLKRFNPVLEAFLPQLEIGNQARIEGSFRQGENAIFTLNAYTDTLEYGQHRFYQNQVEITSSKLPYSPDVLANAIITSRRQQIQGVGQTENIQVEGVWNDRTIQFNSNIAQTNTTNKANINGTLEFLENKVQVAFHNSHVNVLNQVWNITPENTVEISGAGKEIDIRDMVLFFQDQQISLAGQLSLDPSKELKVDLKNFRLENLNPLSNIQLAGVLNASGTLRNVYRQPIIASTLKADSVVMDGYLVGSVAGNTFWDHVQNRLGVDLGITRDQMKVLNVTGYYNPRSEDNSLDLLAVMDEAPLKLVEPLLSSLFGDLAGTMQGRLQITGNISSPILAGSALITNGRFNFKYLNTVYTFTDRIYFTENDITFRNVKMYDILNNSGTISGSIIHQGFKDMILDLRGDFRKLMVLNTTRENNSLYYGTAIATGSATVLGPPSNLVINIDATSEAGTRMSIPLNNNNTVSRQNFIQFVNRNAPDSLATEAAPVDLSGINMNFNLNVTPDAYLEIILDETTGDIVRGSGNGRIKMNIDTRGEFTMEGQVEITRGAYNFTLYNIINKEFLIRPGGTITWNGDPYEGILNLQATYTQTVPIPASVLGANNGETTYTNARVPVTAVMTLAGNLLTPQIKLDLEFNNTPSDLEIQLASFLADIRNDQDELNRQVFSLLILKRLSDRNTIGSANVGAGQVAAQSIYGSLSELVTNQLGNLLSQLDNNLEVDIGLQGTNSNEVDWRALQVRLSYSLLQGRLRVSREGGINNGQFGTEDPNSPIYSNNTLAGDWRVEYFLGQNGKLRLRLEYITSQRRLTNATNAANTAITNISVLHTEQFNTLAELFRRRRLKRKYQVPEKERIILDSDIPYDQIK